MGDQILNIYLYEYFQENLNKAFYNLKTFSTSRLVHLFGMDAASKGKIGG